MAENAAKTQYENAINHSSKIFTTNARIELFGLVDNIQGVWNIFGIRLITSLVEFVEFQSEFLSSSNCWIRLCIFYFLSNPREENARGVTLLGTLKHLDRTLQNERFFFPETYSLLRKNNKHLSDKGMKDRWVHGYFNRCAIVQQFL